MGYTTNDIIGDGEDISKSVTYAIGLVCGAARCGDGALFRYRKSCHPPFVQSIETQERHLDEHGEINATRNEHDINPFSMN